MKGTREYLRGKVPFLHRFFENFKSSSSWCFVSMRKIIFSSTLPGDSSWRWDSKLSWSILTPNRDPLLLPLHGLSWPYIPCVLSLDFSVLDVLDSSFLHGGSSCPVLLLAANASICFGCNGTCMIPRSCMGGAAVQYCYWLLMLQFALAVIRRVLLSARFRCWADER